MSVSELTELFDRDPLFLSDQDLDIIVARLRENQTQHELGAKPVPVVPKAKRSSKAQDLLKNLGLDAPGVDLLKDLGFK
jgi:hypothetical protein